MPLNKVGATTGKWGSHEVDLRELSVRSPTGSLMTMFYM